MDGRARRWCSVTVAALTGAAVLTWSAPASAVTDPAVGPPTDVQVTVGDRSATLTWVPPADEEGAVLALQACAGHNTGPVPADETCVGLDRTATSYRFEGLRGGLTYYFGVRARTKFGWAAGAMPPDAALPPSYPDPPIMYGAETGGRAIAVRWNGAYDSGSPVTGFDLCASPDPLFPDETSTCADISASTSTGSVPGLIPGTAYYARVRARNAIGNSPWSAVSGPAAPYGEPGAPTDLYARWAESASIYLDWTAPQLADGGYPTGWIVTPYIGPEAQPPRMVDSNGTGWWINHLSNGTAYTFDVQAVNAAGTGPRSARSAPMTPVGPGIPTPFADLDAFVAQQRTDFAGSPGTKSSRSAAVALLGNGSLLSAEYIESAMGGSWYRPNVAPTARLYWAYFGRIPDHGGLEYWAGKRRTGTTLIKISASFAGSSEFKRTYGSLSNTQFVDLVYHNVLGRPGDAGGRSYWIGKLNKGASRGQVMANFSESGECVRKTAGRVGVVEVYGGMLDRSPSTAELARWEGEPIQTLIDAIRLGTEYADRVT